MKHSILYLILLSGILLFTTSCGNDDDDDNNHSEGHGTVRIKFENGANGHTLDFNKKYTTASGDTIQVNQLKYYISNIRLIDDGGHEYVETNSYHLVETSSINSTYSVELPEVPEGLYTYFEFSIGVDSTANSDVNNFSGDLDPAGANGMIWNWKTGYKFFRMEGDFWSDQDSTGVFSYHIGENDHYKTISFGTQVTHDAHAKTSSGGHGGHTTFAATVSTDKTTEVHLFSDVLTVFNSPKIVDLDITHKVAVGDTIIHHNYGHDFFEVHHVEQE